MLTDVFSGRDDSPESGRLLQLSRANIAALAEETDPPEEAREELAAQEADWARVTRQPITLVSNDALDNRPESGSGTDA